MCGKKADIIINGIGYEFNPLYEKQVLIQWEKEQGMRRSVFDVNIYVAFKVDHIMPEFIGGLTETSNLTLACRSCNRAKGHRYEVV